MSFSPQGRFQDLTDRHDDSVYGSYNAAEFTRIRCPSCHQIVLVPRGHSDFVHDCTIMCPYEPNVQMLPIPPNPSTAVVPLLPKTADDMMTQDKLRFYFYYCPSSVCPYFIQNKVGYIQQRVQTEIFVGR